MMRICNIYNNSIYITISEENALFTNLFRINTVLIIRNLLNLDRQFIT